MIDDIAVHSLQYADDSVITYTTESGLRRFLDNLKNYCKKWMLEVNIDKTKVMIYHKRKFNLRRHQKIKN